MKKTWSVALFAKNIEKNMSCFAGRLGMAVLLLCTTGTVAATPLQWKAADGGNNHWYDFVNSPSGISFDDARSAAVGQGGYLATPNLAGEGDFIFMNLTLPAQGSTYWLGAYSNGVIDSYQWQWVTGGYVTAWGGPTYFDWTLGAVAGDYGGIQGLTQVPSSWWVPGNFLQDLPTIYAAVGYVVEFTGQPNQDPQPSNVPEPSTILLFSMALAGLLGVKSRPKK